MPTGTYTAELPTQCQAERAAAAARYSRDQVTHGGCVTPPPMTVKTSGRVADTTLVDRDLALSLLPCLAPANLR
jgi:hypothetical protein